MYPRHPGGSKVHNKGEVCTERRRNISRLKLSSVVWYIQKTKRHRNSNFRVTSGISMCHEVIFHVIIGYLYVVSVSPAKQLNS